MNKNYSQKTKSGNRGIKRRDFIKIAAGTAAAAASVFVNPFQIKVAYGKDKNKIRTKRYRLAPLLLQHSGKACRQQGKALEEIIKGRGCTA